MFDFVAMSRAEDCVAAPPLAPFHPARRRSGRRATDRTGAEMAAVLPFILGVVEGLPQGLAVLRAPDQVVYANPAARQVLAEGDWRIRDGVLSGPREIPAQDWHRLVHNASERQCRGIFDLRPGADGPLVSVVPLPIGGDVLALLTFGRTQVCGPLELQLFASRHRLSHAETQVLRHLCQGHRPAAVAHLNGVAVSTVVSQISAIRVKTDCSGIDQLLQRLACLPPMRDAVSGAGDAIGSF